VEESIDVITDGTADGACAALIEKTELGVLHPKMFCADTLNPYSLPTVSPAEPPVTEYVLTSEAGE
jgi:hypothetical protein